MSKPIDCEDYLGDGECWQLDGCNIQFQHQKCCWHCDEKDDCGGCCRFSMRRGTA